MLNIYKICVSIVPPEYFCHLDMNGRRADIDQRPELKYGTVEFTAPEVIIILITSCRC